MYFREFPKLFYTFPSLANPNRVISDITQNVRVRKAILESVLLYDEYDVKDGETPEVIAEKVYGDPEYHWIVLLANNKYDYINDFPLSEQELIKHIERTYGENSSDLVHHYSLYGNEAYPETSYRVSSGIIADFDLNDLIVSKIISPSAILLAKIVNIDYDTNKLILKQSSHNFQFPSLCNVIRNGEIIFELNITETVPFTINEPYKIVTNYDYETSINESKRRIKIISKRFIDQILKEYRELMNV